MKDILRIVIPVALVLLCLPFLASAEADADVGDSGSEGESEYYYCYGDHPTLRYSGVQTDRTVDWVVLFYDKSGSPIGADQYHENEFSVTLDLSDESIDSVKVVQTVTSTIDPDESDAMTLYLTPLHVFGSEGEIEIVFMDGSYVFDRQTITNKTVVKVGDDHFLEPYAAPEKVGYEFAGWYTDTGFSQNLNTKNPIYDDLTVYAKWTSQGTEGPDNPPVEVQNHLVLFETDRGLEYKVIGQTGDSVTFMVNVVGGFNLIGDIEVTSDGGVISSSNGVYTLSDIDSDTTVTISGQTEVAGGGSSTIHVDRVYTVTFNTTVGLEYTVVSQGDRSVSFQVNVTDGYVLRGDADVTSNRGSISFAEGIYTLSGISTNTVVTIDGEVTPILDPGGIDEPEEPKEPADDGGFPLWIVVVIIVIIVAVVAAIWYMRGRI